VGRVSAKGVRNNVGQRDGTATRETNIARTALHLGPIKNSCYLNITVILKCFRGWLGPPTSSSRIQHLRHTIRCFTCSIIVSACFAYYLPSSVRSFTCSAGELFSKQIETARTLLNPFLIIYMIDD
jgi:hypothetical protein